MPILSFYEGYTELSFGVFEDKIDAEVANIFRFPYTYSNNLFENSFPRDKFYKDVFSVAGKELNFDLKNCALYNASFLSVPELPFESKKSTSVFSNLSNSVIYVSSQMIALNKEFYSYMPFDANIGDMNFRMNLDMYHNIISLDSHDVVLKDALLREIIQRSTFNLESGEFILTGDRFREFAHNPSLTYLLIFDLIKDPGVFFLRLDKDNLYAHSVSIEDSTLSYPYIGTLINIAGNVECLYETEVGTSQLFDLKEDNIFMLPLNPGSDAKIMVKSSNQSFEQKVLGGSLGVVIDTREKTKHTEFKEVYLNMVKQSMNRI